MAMARTLRRKSVPMSLVWTLRNWQIEGGIYRRVTLDPKSPEGKKALAKFYSDHGFGNYRYACPPRRYRRELTGRDRRLEQADLRKWMADRDYDTLPRRWGRDAKWYW
jgi:hypothetical protein